MAANPGPSSGANSSSLWNQDFNNSLLNLIEYVDPTDHHVKIRIFEQLAPNWERIARCLGLDSAQIETIKCVGMGKTPSQCLMDVLRHWEENAVQLSNPNRYPANWEGVYNLLEDSSHGQLAMKLQAALDAEISTFHQNDSEGPSGQVSSSNLAPDFPYLQTDQLSEDEILFLRYRLYKETNKMKHNFAVLLTKLDEELQGVGLNKILTYLVSYDCQKFKNVHRSVSTFSHLWPKVREYVSFFDYDLVENLIDTFGSDAIKESLKTYNILFAKFAERRVSECPSDAFDETDVNESQRIGLLITDKLLQEITLEDVKMMKCKFNEILGPKKLIKVLCVKGGSILIIFRIIEPFIVTEEQKIALKKAGVDRIIWKDLVVDLSTIGKRAIAELAVLVKCDNVERNCEWVGTVGTLQEHMATCKFAPLVCPEEKMEMEATLHKFASLPSTIDQKVVVRTLKSQQALLLLLTRHCLPSLANSLFAEAMIPQDVYDTVCNENKGKSERCVALLDCVEARVKLVPSDFTKVVHILKSEPFLESLADILVKVYNTLSSELVATSSSAISHYHTYLKAMYKNSYSISPESKWPPKLSREYITLALIEGIQGYRDNYINALQGTIMEPLISTEQILENPPDKKWRLCLVEGAPGIGKSTLAWELCRKWEEFPCMQQYSLVVLLRLREEEVQKISSVADLFYSYESEDKKSLVAEVQMSQGRGILFILDGFDELPKSLQQNGFLLNLIRGSVLPLSTVLVTSRPSATAELLASCYPQKRVEILGFTQESIEAYASSVFSSEPEKLLRFRDNPIKSLMYVPLYATIVMLIYCKSDSMVPPTFTQLCLQLCLTLLKGYSMQSYDPYLVNVDGLPTFLQDVFIKFSEVAFEGMKNDEVIFHSLFPSLTQFGFLNAVPVLYGGEVVSYNFLHFALQEFFAAYYISKLDVKGQEIMAQHGNNTKWAGVWIFVAGLTRFKAFSGWHNMFDNHEDTFEISKLFIECLYEAQTFRFLEPSLRMVTTFQACLYNDDYTLYELFTLAYCIANISIGNKAWVLHMQNISAEGFKSFASVFMTHVLPGVGVIKKLEMIDCLVDVDDIRHLNVSELELNNSISDLSHFSKILLFVTGLKKLVISKVSSFELSLLEQLYHSNVSSLSIMNTGFCKAFREAYDDYCPALQKLIDPVSGRLEELCLGDSLCHAHEAITSDDALVNLVSFSSSLHSLTLNQVDASLSPFGSNTCHLTSLRIYLHTLRHQQVPSIVHFVKHNRHLQHLSVHGFRDSLDLAKTVAYAVIFSTTLQTVKLGVYDASTITRMQIVKDDRVIWIEDAFSPVQ